VHGWPTSSSWTGLDPAAAQQEAPGILCRPGPQTALRTPTFTQKTDAERWLADERR
jgi:hypothetical protein